jgi:inner membrane protein YidH
MTSGSNGPGVRPSADDMARTRTVQAADRTLMAWIRTALSMISFGFTIYKFLQGLHEAATIQLRHPQGPRELGLFLAALGTASVVIGLVQYRHVLRETLGPSTHAGLTAYVAGAVLLLGVLVCFGLVTRMGPF